MLGSVCLFISISYTCETTKRISIKCIDSSVNLFRMSSLLTTALQK